jgi:hypothetical protein
VAGNFVTLLTFSSTIFLSIPLAPLSIIFVPIYFFVIIKWQRFMTLKYWLKPKRPWKAHRAGLAFAKLFLVIVLFVGVPATTYFLNSKTFPKNCSIQDQHVGLCLTPIGVSTSSPNVCVTDPNSIYYTSYGGSSSSGTTAGSTTSTSTSTYPESICGTACGPFQDSVSNITPFKQVIFEQTVLLVVWELCFSYPYIPWIALIALVVVVVERGNKVAVEKRVSEQRERALEVHVQTLEAEQKKQAKVINRLKAVQAVPPPHHHHPYGDLTVKENILSDVNRGSDGGDGNSSGNNNGNSSGGGTRNNYMNGIDSIYINENDKNNSNDRGSNNNNGANVNMVATATATGFQRELDSPTMRRMSASVPRSR